MILKGYKPITSVLKITSSYIDKHLASSLTIVQGDVNAFFFLQFMSLDQSGVDFPMQKKKNSSISVNIHLNNHAKLFPFVQKVLKHFLENYTPHLTIPQYPVSSSLPYGKVWKVTDELFPFVGVVYIYSPHVCKIGTVHYSA